MIKKMAPVKAFGEQEALVEAYIEQKTPEEDQNKELALEEAQIPENYEISINYVHNREKWDRNKVIINNIFSFQMALDIIRNDKNPEPQNVEECRNRNDWPKWKEAMQAELNLLMKRDVFGHVVQTPKGVKSVGYKWVFVRKRNENNEIIRYKV